MPEETNCVLGTNINHVQRLVRTLPLLVWRQLVDTSTVCTNEPTQLADLRKAGVYVGFTDAVIGLEALRV